MNTLTASVTTDMEIDELDQYDLSKEIGTDEPVTIASLVAAKAEDCEIIAFYDAEIVGKNYEGQMDVFNQLPKRIRRILVNRDARA